MTKPKSKAKPATPPISEPVPTNPTPEVGADGFSVS